jgi:hypothetical protein
MNNVIHISEEQSEKAKILAGEYGHQAKKSLEWRLSNAISTEIDEAKQYAEQEFPFEASRFERFDIHYRRLRDLFVTHLQLVNKKGPDNYHLFDLYPHDQDRSGILPRMADLRDLCERSLQSQAQIVNGETSGELTSGSEFIRELRAELWNASNSGQVGSHVNSYLGQLTAVTLDVHPEICSILEKHGFIQGEFADQFLTQLSSENMLALAHDLLLTDHTEPMQYPKMTTAAPVEDTEDTVQWRCEQVLAMVLEHAGKPLNKPGVITSVDSDEKYKVKMQHNSKEITVAGNGMKRMEPQKEKEVIVISGPDKGQRGQLYEIDGEDGIVQLPDDINILDMWRICACEDEGERPTMTEREYDLASIGPRIGPGDSGHQLGLNI